MGTKKKPSSKTKPAPQKRTAARAASTAPSTYRIFVNYRRDDCGSEVQWFAKHLEDVFGAEHVFCDQRAIAPGDTWPDEIRDALDGCTIVLACIGAKWHSLLNHEQTKLRLDDPEDWVRQELVRAREGGIRVQPILFDGLPGLPMRAIAERKELSFLNEKQAAPLRATRDLDRDCEEVIAAIEKATKLRRRQHAAAAPADLLERYRQEVRRAHEHLTPFFPEFRGKLLRSVFVQVEVCDMDDRSGADESAPGESRTRAKLLAAKDARFGHQVGPLADFVLGTAGVVAASEPVRLVVVGEPGAGKSTLARDLANTLASAAEPGRLPVFVALGRLTNGWQDPFVIAAQDALGASSPQAATLAERLRAEAIADRAVLLLDGLDEVGDLQSAVEGIQQIAAEVASPIVVMARPIALKEAPLADFRRADVQPLSDGRREELVHNLLGAHDGARFVAQFAQRPGLAEMCRNPLLLTMAAMVGRESLQRHEPVPTKRGEIYQRTIDLMLRRGHVQDGHGVRDWRLAHEVLARLSLWLHERGGEAWPSEVVEDGVWQVRCEATGGDRAPIEARIVRTWRPEPGQHESEQRILLADIASNAGVIGPLDVQTDHWRYLHRSLREFLVAERLAEFGVGAWRPRIEAWAKAVKAADGEEEQQKAHAQWAEVFALLVGCVPESQRLEVLKAIREVHPPLALRALGNADGLPVADGVAFAMADREVGGDDLLRWFRAWGVDGVEATRLLMPHVGQDTTSDRLGSIWFVLEELGAPPVREVFFDQAGRPADAAVELSWAEIPAGRFLMGSPEGEEGRLDWEGPQHEVRVPAFRMARTPVTDAQYRSFDAGHPRQKWSPRGKGANVADGDCPVVGVSWWAAYAYCRWVGGELPSEAQWEYACRARTTTPYWSGGSEGDLKRVGWYDRNSRGRVHPVGKKDANALGLHDVHGSVWEWCQDRWHDSYQGAPADGSAWVEGGSGDRVVRGGSRAYPATWCRSASRFSSLAVIYHGLVGFRPSSSSLHPLTTSPADSAQQARGEQSKPGHTMPANPRPKRSRRKQS